MNESLIYLLLKGGKKSIREGNRIYFLRMGKLCSRKLNDNNSGENWKHTPKRNLYTGTFAGNRYMSSHMKDAYENLPVWQPAAAFRTGGILSGDNYRHSMNHAYVDKEGNVTDFKHFTVSEGSLVLPPDMTLEREGNTIRLTWHDDRDAPSASGSDCPYAIIIGDRRPDALIFARDNEATRAGGSATFTVKAREGENLHVYPFFGNAGSNAFSPNEYFYAPASK